MAEIVLFFCISKIFPFFSLPYHDQFQMLPDPVCLLTARR